MTVQRFDVPYSEAAVQDVRQRLERTREAMSCGIARAGSVAYREETPRLDRRSQRKECPWPHQERSPCVQRRFINSALAHSSIRLAARRPIEPHRHASVHQGIPVVPRRAIFGSYLHCSLPISGLIAITRFEAGRKNRRPSTRIG